MPEGRIQSTLAAYQDELRLDMKNLTICPNAILRGRVEVFLSVSSKATLLPFATFSQRSHGLRPTSFQSVLHSPAGTPGADRKRSGCPRRPTGPGWMAGSVGRLWAPPCRDCGPWRIGCRTPSWSPRAAGWTGRPTGCEASPARPPAPGYLRGRKGKLLSDTEAEPDSVYCC